MESVNELAQIMKDLSVLVIDQVWSLLLIISWQLSHISWVINFFFSIDKQGTIIDRIDYNIQNVATTVEEGLKELQKVLTSFLIVHFILDFLLSLSVSLPLPLPSPALVLYTNVMSVHWACRQKEHRDKGGW